MQSSSNSAAKKLPENTAPPLSSGWKNTQRTLLRDGISLQLEIDPVAEQSHPAANTEHAFRIRLAVDDATTHAPLTGLHPSAWMSLRGAEDIPCNIRARTFLRRGLMEKQADLDLTDYYVLVLNQDGTIHVVDPQFSSGQARLISSIQLSGRADDWLLSSDQSKLFVSISEAGEILMIDTATWTIVHRAKIAGATKLALQPDEHYLWASYAGSESGVALLSTSDLRVAKKLPLHAGRHDIAFSSDSHLAFVTDPGAASISIFDVARLEPIKELKTSGPASSIAYASASQFAYATTTSGNILAINAQGAIAASIPSEAGLTHIAFFGDGRFGFALNPDKGLVHVLDTAHNTLIQTAAINASPEQIVFTDQLAYIIRRDSDLIEMVPLDSLGPTDNGSATTSVSAVELPAGHNAFSNASANELTTAMVQAPGENAVVFANAGDKSIFYYEEGMAAPMGTFNNFGKEPRSVLVVDRSLKETSPGIYETSGSLKKAGVYVVPIVLDSPRIVECFEVPLGTEEPAPAETGNHH